MPPAWAMMPSTSGWSSSPTITTESPCSASSRAHVCAAETNGHVASTTSRPFSCGGRDDRGVHAVRADDEDAVVGFLEACGDLHALLAQLGDRLRVVDERAERVHFDAAARSFLGELERALDAVADACVTGDLDVHVSLLPLAVRADAMRRMISAVIASIRSLRPPSAKSLGFTGS